MKKTLVLYAGLLMFSLALPTFADEDSKVTVTGQGKCAKCVLKEADKCQNVIETTENGKKVKYYLAKNDVNKNFQEDLCTDGKKVTATGTVKEVDGKKQLTATKIELAKD